ncbi:DUF3445 domain-containing protein [Rhodococcus sp. AD45-ID]|uniref:heme-dependent oxidative N-demethylase family protein n=1 Tax=unclassified Rhodococcus (in: high G+C Gram-positive bacteria) TaxID=192944 RepID=UPI0005D2F79D|nr:MULTISPECIES: DUF3445 domain-containing protein [unclassified Rhodococcus (in: high G+C Gram-positive bacteria)]KJF24422.1 hypothetical protein SZ00_01343 [Rhodococcus sp. AD45]PSR42723.1 DUF3445 domain-containing protein [Rhodococcus sp. AD45-ID]
MNASAELLDVPTRIANFPFPFAKDSYRYSTNVEPAGTPARTAAGEWGKHTIEIDENYHHELAERTRILASDASRYQSLPHMMPAQWDAMISIMRMLAESYPDSMSLERDGTAWIWRNGLLDTEQRFVVGDLGTLPIDPLRFATNQIQEDVVLLDQREGQLWGDAGVVTFAADWSLRFDVGMSFLQIHGPVPRVHAEGIVSRAQSFLMRLEPGERYRRTNWTLTVDGKLDTSTETYPQWGPDRTSLARGPLEDVGDRLFLRVEVQHLIRLANSGSIMFLIRSYLLPLRDIASVPVWAQRLHAVLDDLPEDMADYKGITKTRGPAMEWLRAHAGVGS